jgi:single-strand DNA-binding protein
MIESTVTVQGYVGAEPTLRTAGSHQVANFRVACTPRRLNRATGEWADAPTQWYTVNAWRQLGENVARSLHKGDPVVVHGRLMARSYQGKDGVEVNTLEIEASIVGHDLNRGHSVLRKNDRRDQPPATGLEQAQRDWGGQPIGDPPGLEQPPSEEEAPVPAA